MEVAIMRKFAKYFGIVLVLVFGFWAIFDYTGVTNSPTADAATRKTKTNAFKKFRKFAGKYSGTWTDLEQGRQGDISATFTPKKKKPQFIFNLEGISGLPFTGTQKITGVYKGKKAVFKSPDKDSFGNTTIILTSKGKISVKGTGLPFGVAFTGTGTIDKKKGVDFNYKITQGNFSFNATAELARK